MKKRTGKPTLAERADRHELYEQAVQDADLEAEFLADTFKRARGREARTMREDFCGTARVACEWVAGDDRHEAIAVDHDEEVLAWGRENNLPRLSEAERKRIRLVQSDVLDGPGENLDLVIAMNFSYWAFEDRASMLRYFRGVRRVLAPDGLFLLDAYGGSEAYEEMQEETKINGFTYIWDQADFDPVTGHAVCHIHFKFRDGSRMDRAFSYEWRLWTLPEIRELLDEAGFSRTTVLWQGTDEEMGEGNGEFEPAERGDADPAWIAYVQAEP